MITSRTQKVLVYGCNHCNIVYQTPQIRHIGVRLPFHLGSSDDYSRYLMSDINFGPTLIFIRAVSRLKVATCQRCSLFDSLNL